MPNAVGHSIFNPGGTSADQSIWRITGIINPSSTP